MIKLQLGTYQHFKGNKYLVIGLAKHSETLEEMVDYIGLYDNPQGSILIRPLKMFLENVTRDSVTMPRFKKLAD